MSKQRAQARAAREALAQERIAAHDAERERAALARARRQRRVIVWKRLRLWQRAALSRRNAERRAALATMVLLLLVVAYLVTGTMRGVLIAGLILVVSSPLLLKLFFDRSD